MKVKASKSAALGTEPIGKLLIKQSVPASIGILVMSLNILVDTIFVGNWIGAEAIAAINIVLPVSFFIAALGMAIGIGGSSIISRALGNHAIAKARKTFGNQISLSLLIVLPLVFLGLKEVEVLIPAFGGKGSLYEPAKIYYQIILYGVPILAMCMMGNTVIRAEGKPKIAMIAMIIPSVGNLLLDYIFIKLMGFGMAGAAWASTISYLLCFLFILYFFITQSEIRLKWHDLKLNKIIVYEIGALSFVTLARQAVISVLYLILNNVLFRLGGASGVAVYAIVARMLMFAYFPVLGVTQGFLPIAGYNFGAKQYDRVIASIEFAMKYALLVAIVIFAAILYFPREIAAVFTDEPEILAQAPQAIRWVFAALPIVVIQLIGAAYYQAIGRAVPALLLTLSRQGFFLIPLVLILPRFYDTLGVWVSFAIADVLSTLLTGYFLWQSLKKLKFKQEVMIKHAALEE